MLPLRKHIQLASSLSLGCGAIFAYNDEGIRRSARFWSFAFPAYLHYELYDYLYRDHPLERSQAFNRLHDIYSPRAESLVFSLRGYFLKAAQLMSVRDDFTPPQYLAWCRRIQDQAPVTFTSQRAREIAEEGGVRYDSWDDIPIGSASIGQVYRARLNGQDVAVKVQGDDVERQFRIDMKQLRRFCELAMPQFVAPLREIEAQFMTEFDYRAEAQNLKRVRENLMNSPWASKVVVPKPFEEYCSKRVLVMEYLKGVKLTDLLERYLNDEALRQRRNADEVRLEFMEQLRVMDSFNNTWSEYMKRHAWLATVRTINACKWLVGITPDTSLTSIDTMDLLNTVMKVHGYQVLVNGEFNGDPHPGNLLLLDDGRVGLIDFGQVKRFTDDVRMQIARLVIAINQRDVDTTTALLEDIGIVSKYSNTEVQYRLASFWLDRDTPDITGGLTIHRFLEEMEKIDPAIEVSRNLVMVCRCSVMIRSLACALGLKVGTTDYWLEYANLAIK